MTLSTHRRFPTLDIIRTSVTGRTTDYSVDPTHMNVSLWDFDINGSQLKADHYRWLAKAVDKVNTSYASFIWHIWISGGASLTGVSIQPNNGWNYALAKARAAEVYKFLTDNLKVLGLVYHGPDTAGLELATYEGHRLGVEDDHDRAVYVRISTDSTPPPPPPKPTTIPVSSEFSVRWESGGSMGALGLAVDSSLFRIADTKNHLYSDYEYGGASASLSHTYTPLSITMQGDWVGFTTTGDLHISEFDGPAKFQSHGGGPVSVNLLTLTPNGGVETVPGLLEIESGFTFGLGASLPFFGYFHLRSRAFPYTGTLPP